MFPFDKKKRTKQNGSWGQNKWNIELKKNSPQKQMRKGKTPTVVMKN